MAYLLMFVTLLHLITLAILFIATMEKVVVILRTANNRAQHIQLYVSCLFSL